MDSVEMAKQAWASSGGQVGLAVARFREIAQSHNMNPVLIEVLVSLVIALFKEWLERDKGEDETHA